MSTFTLDKYFQHQIHVLGVVCVAGGGGCVVGAETSKRKGRGLTDMLSGSIPSQPRSIAFCTRALMMSYTALRGRVGERVGKSKDPCMSWTSELLHHGSIRALRSLANNTITSPTPPPGWCAQRGVCLFSWTHRFSCTGLCVGEVEPFLTRPAGHLTLFRSPREVTCILTPTLVKAQWRQQGRGR